MLALHSNHVLLHEEPFPVPATILICPEDGRIVDLGRDISVPAGVPWKDLEDAYILPGLIDCHTHIGMDGPGGDPVTDRNEPYALNAPQLRAVDAIDFLHVGFSVAAKAGITMVAVLPGSYSVVCGQVGAMVTYSFDRTGYIFKENIGMKCAMGIHPRMAADAANTSPKTKMAILAMIRESILHAQRAIPNLKTHRDIASEGWWPVLNGNLPLRVHVYRACEMASVIDLADHFKLKLVFEHGAEAIALKDELIQRDIPVVCTNTFYHVPSTREETAVTPDLPARMMQAGIRVALSTNFPEVAIGTLTQYAGQCLKYGVTWKQAIDSITRIPAEIMGIYDETGSIKSGKRADISIWNGDPLNWQSNPIAVMINGIFVPGGGIE
jgi:imidazolonepropionase-like amidohydrolase